MTAVLPRPDPLRHPHAADAERADHPQHARRSPTSGCIHQTVRREFRLLAGLASWAPADDAVRTAEITRHADLIARVLMQHHATERELLWPALFRSLPDPEAARDVVADWTSRTALLDHTPPRPLDRRAAVGGGGDRSGARRLRPRLHPRWPTPSRTPPAPRSATCCRCCRSTCRTATGRRSPARRRPRCPAASRCSCWVSRSRTPARSTAPACSPASPPPPAPPGGSSARRNFHAAVVRLRGAPPAA